MSIGQGGYAEESALLRRRGGPAYAVGLKRAFDLMLLALVSLPALTLVLVLAAAIARDGHWPFYVQQRLGRGRRVYRMWKLRTMHPGADALLGAYLAENPEAAAEWGHAQKLKADPRITPLGRLLRKSSLDELPQLWNVARGEMSFVGPRPIMVGQRHLYPGQDYYELRPGLTGPWQVSDRNECSFEDRARFDSVYATQLSFLTDLRLLAQTVRVVLRGTGY